MSWLRDGYPWQVSFILKILMKFLLVFLYTCSFLCLQKSVQAMFLQRSLQLYSMHFNYRWPGLIDSDPSCDMYCEIPTEESIHPVSIHTNMKYKQFS